MSDISAGEGIPGATGATGLQHKPSYRHVSAGTLFKTVQEGMQRELTKGMIAEDDDDGEDDEEETIADRLKRIALASQAGPVTQRRHDYPTAHHHAPPPQEGGTTSALSVQDMKSLTFGKNMAMIRSRSKIMPGTSAPSSNNSTAHMHSGTNATTTTAAAATATAPPEEIHPGERVFSPVVTCRYPEVDWPDSEAFPAHLSLFCFPGELCFKLQDERPPTTFHSFVMTQETGNRSYAMCVTLYERLPDAIHRQYDQICQKWTREHMSESEVEYVKAIKTKITKEKALLREFRSRFQEEKTLGRKNRLIELQREMIDSEEKLYLLEDQMKPWRKLFVEAEDVWMPRCIGLVSAIPYHYLLRDWLLAVVVACSGGVEHPGMSLSSLRLESYVRNIIHDVNVPPFGKMEIGITINNRLIYASRPALNSVPIVKNFSLFPLFRCLSAEDIVTVIEVILSEGRIIFLSSHLGMLTLASESFLYLLFPLYWQGVYIPILPAALMTCLQAPVPYIIGVERSCCDSDFPPEDACVIDLDRGSINVQLPPMQLPPRPRRKLVQSLEQYAPTCAMRRPNTAAAGTAATRNDSLGPPEYVKVAFPHSRLTLFCGVSRAPRWNRRQESFRPPMASTLSTMTTNSIASGIIGHGGGSGNGNGNGHGGPNGMNNSPSVSRKSSSNTLGQQSLSRHPTSQELQGLAITSASVTQEDLHADMNGTKVSSGHNPEKDEQYSTATRKTMSPAKTRASMFEMPRKQQESALHPLSQPSQSEQQQSIPAPINTTMTRPTIDRSNSSHHTSHSLTNLDNSSSISTVNGSGNLSHRASLTSIESTTSSVQPRSSTLSQIGPLKTGSPISTMTSYTMNSINGPPSSQVSTPTAQPPPFLPTPAYTIPKPGEAGIDGIPDGALNVALPPEAPSVPIIREGHVLSSVSSPVPLSLIQSSRCGICSHGLQVHQQVYRCEGCSLFVHAGCIDELLYPCVPRGFDESGICWSVLQMWAGLMKGYRSGILAGHAAMIQQQQLQQQQILFQQQLQQQQQQQLQLQAQHQRQNIGHSKQLSSSGSEDGTTGSNSGSRDRLSWASFRGWTTRSITGAGNGSSNSTSAANNGSSSVSNGGLSNNTNGIGNRGTTSFSPPAPRSTTMVDSTTYPSPQMLQHQQPGFTRARSGTNGSTHSDTVRFHRDVFMKSVDREARPFMSAFTESQAFVQFVQDRVDRSPGDPEIMFFDEVIKAKINRSRFRLGKEETKFLDDPTYGIQGTVRAIPPSGELQPHDKNLRRFPTSLDPAYM
ncbi:hypothetical protein EMPS_07613 [Entomortierella parvispora]|uniref:UDENN domain-containing protein n=1 Tax=Entomortierella parvispora TaxID=205924 RepID=A0A9P3HEF4_9FUNG|nr:hypothetical protein EMPS_07613 [Entomortierella parvispora]